MALLRRSCAMSSWLLFVAGPAVCLAAERQAASADEQAPPKGYQRIREDAFEMLLPEGWERCKTLPRGVDVGYRKPLGGGGEATFHLHHEPMPAEAGPPPSDTSDIQQQFDTLLQSQFPGATKVAAMPISVKGKVLVNLAYVLTDEGARLRRQYSYFLHEQTAFVVQCNAPPQQWDGVSKEFAGMLSSLQAASKGPAKKISLEAALKEMEERLPILPRSFPDRWSYSLTGVRIVRPPADQGKVTVEIAVAFQRADIGSVYRSTRTLVRELSEGKNFEDYTRDAEREGKGASLRSSLEFLQYVGQLVGLAAGSAAKSEADIKGFTVLMHDPDKRKVGSAGISWKDLIAHLQKAKTEVSDLGPFARMWVFE